MQDFHAARPWLVVDNSSPSDSSTPCSRASRSNRKCHLAGIQPRQRHIEMVFDRTPGKCRAKADGPPNREIMSVVSSMGNSDITKCNVSQASKCDAVIFRVLSQSVDMSKSSDKQDKAAALIRAAALNRAAADRVASLEKLSGDDRKTFARRMGLTYGAYKNALSRKQFTGAGLMSLALSLEASLDYVTALTDEAAPLNRPAKPKTFWEMKG